MAKIIKFLFFLSLVFGSTVIEASQPVIRFRRITNRKGLSHDWVKSVYRDSYGYMWFGTRDDGLNKYNGRDFTIYKHKPGNDTTSLSNNIIQIIKEDKKQNLWVGTAYGINKYNRDLDRFEPYYPFYQSYYRYVNGFSEGNNGKIFLITLHDIILLDTKNDTISFIIKKSQKLPYTFIEKGIIKYSNNKFLLGTTDGLFLLDVTNKNNITPVIKDIHVRAMYKDSKENIWIGTVKNGLFRITYKEKGSTEMSIKNFVNDNDNKYSLSAGEITALNEDNNGFLWIGTGNDGLNLLELKTSNTRQPVFYHYKSDPYNESTLTSNSITTIYKDFEGTMWIGTFNGGINYYNEILFKFNLVKKNSNTSNSLNSNKVNTFYEEGENLWIGTENGLNIYIRKNNKWLHFTHNKKDKSSISSNAVWAIFRDSRKNMWIGTWAGGLNLFEDKKKTFTHYLHNKGDKSGISSNNIFDITEDKGGVLWVPTMGGGLDRFDYKTKTFKAYKNNIDDTTSILNDWVRGILISRDGEIWVGTCSGLDLFDKEKEIFHHFRHLDENPKSLSSNDVITAFEDSKNNVWVGTETGLNLLNPGSSNFVLYSEKDGLPNNVIRGILEDNHGNLWISTNKGLSKFVNAINRPENPEFINYTREDGLQGNSFNSRSCFKDKNGKLYFGGNNGFNVFYPDSIKENTNKPEIVFTDFLIFNKPVEIGKEDSPLKKHISVTKQIVLSYKHSVISIKYAALNFLAPEKNQYAYMLEGFDKNWNYVGNKREVTYTNLNPGRYTFRVKGSNNDGVWNEKGTSLKIIITPPFWKTIWFRLTMIVLTLLAIYGVYLIRVKNIVLYERELEKKVEERTEDLKKSNQELEEFAYIVSHDLKAPLRGITQLSDWIYKDYTDVLDKEGKENLELLRERTKRMNALIQGILQYSRVERKEGKAEKVDLNELVEEVIDLLSPPDNIKIMVADKLPEYAADRSRLTQVFQNLISNAIKHMDKEEGLIKIGCAEKDKEWEFNISDNGPGIDKKYQEKIFKIFQRLDPKEGNDSTGIGLTIVKKIVEMYGGRIWVESTKDKGSAFYFTLLKKGDTK